MKLVYHSIQWSKGLENQGQKSFIQVGNRWKSMNRTLPH